jgi:hypothetical protein
LAAAVVERAVQVVGLVVERVADSGEVAAVVVVVA